MAVKSYVAGGTIQPCCFVIMDVTSNEQVVAASGTSPGIVGISFQGSELAPIPSASSYVAASGDSVAVYGVGEICLLQATTAGWTAGDLLTSNSTGQGITASSNNYVGAIAQETITGAVLGRVEVFYGVNS